MEVTSTDAVLIGGHDPVLFQRLVWTIELLKFAGRAGMHQASLDVFRLPEVAPRMAIEDGKEF